MNTMAETQAPAGQAGTSQVWVIWAEGFVDGGVSEKAWQVNEAPIPARSLDEAVSKHRFTTGNSPEFQRWPDGTWTYWGCRLFDNESDARDAFG